MLSRSLFGIVAAFVNLSTLSFLACKSAPIERLDPPTPQTEAAAPTATSNATSGTPTAAGSATGTAPASSTASDDAAPAATAVADVGDDPKLSFLDNRMQRAKAGTRELVSLRVWHCGPSCTCPPPCIQSVSEEVSMKWIDLLDEAGKPVAVPDWTNVDVVGRFTGRTRKAKGPSPEEHILPEFRIVGVPAVVNKAMAPETEGAHAKVVLRGPLAEKTVPKVHDANPYVVVVGTFPLSNADHEEAATKLLKRVQDAGFADAQRVDSRAFSNLACCFDLVIAGRFPDVPSAETRRAALTAKRFHPYVKKGF
ncbi:MAG: hypothetical protein U0174_27000 [Polyangiaceae bacterium]